MIRITNNQKIKQFIKEIFKMSINEFVEKYSNLIIKKGSRIIKKTKSYEIVGVRNTRDKYLAIEILIDLSTSNNSVNIQRLDIARGSY